MDLVKEKIGQVAGILNELNIDLWLVFVRETSMIADPVMPLVVGEDVTWFSFFLYARTGEKVALVGNLDRDVLAPTGRFDEIHCYTESAREDLIPLLDKSNPASIAINYSETDVASDGLTHGMYRQLKKYLEGTPYTDRLVSAEDICGKLRGRKTTGEIDCLTSAATIAEQVWQNVIPSLETGLTEKEVAAVIEAEMAMLGFEPSFPTIVNAGDKTSPGHGRPTDAKLEPGDLLHIDFGVICDDYCSDLQRLLYFTRPGEQAAPAELTDAFDTVATIITATAQKCLPGVKGYEIDALARQMLRDNGYEVYQHALGHQLGRSVHDGGAILGPKWERYGRSPVIEIEENNVFTLELEIILPGIGCVGLEEDICVTPQGGKFLCRRQLEPITK